MIQCGECLACKHIGTCSETSIEKVLQSFTCPLFEPVEEPIYMARWMMMQKYGERQAVETFLFRHNREDEESDAPSTGD